jgi:hypothetical protein
MNLFRTYINIFLNFHANFNSVQLWTDGIKQI